MKDKLAELVKRRHPAYEGRLAHWDFLEATYEGGREWFAGNIFRYIKEGDTEYAERVSRAYRFNHTKQVVDLVDKYLFKMPVARKTTDAPASVQAFWQRATLTGLPMETFAKRISTATSKYGRVWLVVDSTAQEGGTITVADEKAGDVRIYSYIVRPQDMLDISYDDMGEMNWALIREFKRDDEDPYESSGAWIPRYRLWTRLAWYLFEEQEVRGKKRVVQIDEGNHYLGEVPVVQADHNFSEESYESAGLIDDIAYLDRANANYLSNLDAIIQDQTFSQLAMPAQGLLPGEDAYGKVVDMATKRVFLYNGEAGGKPEYLSPDPRQAQLILTAIGKIINEIYHSVGLAGERTQEDNGGGIDNASGVAKAYDFEKVNTLLTAKADALEVTEKRLARMVALWAGEEERLSAVEDLVVYPRDFDTRGLYDEFEIGARLSLLSAPDEFRQEQMKSVAAKLFPAASKELAKKLDEAIKKWTPTADALVSLSAEPGGKKPAGAVKAAGTQKTAKEMAA
jgi:hypothetical protein